MVKLPRVLLLSALPLEGPRARAWVLGLGLRVWGLGLRALGLGFRIKGLGLRV